MLTSLTHHKKGPAWFKILDYGKCNGYMREIVRDVLHDHDYRAPPCKVSFRNAFYHVHQKDLFVVVEGFTRASLFTAEIMKEGPTRYLEREKYPLSFRSRMMRDCGYGKI